MSPHPEKYPSGKYEPKTPSGKYAAALLAVLVAGCQPPPEKYEAATPEKSACESVACLEEQAIERNRGAMVEAMQKEGMLD